MSFQKFRYRIFTIYSSNQYETPKINEKEAIIGIDLGITNYFVAIFKHNISNIIVDKSGI